MRAIWCTACFIVLLVWPTWTLHEDEVGKYDWYKERIGAVEQAVFPAHPRLVKRRLVFVATAESVVAALNVQAGNVVWRRVFAKGEQINNLRLFDRVLLVLSSNQHLQAWDAENGLVLWSAHINLAENAAVLFKGFVAGTDPQGAILLGIALASEAGASSNIHAFTFNVQDGSGLTEKVFPLPVESLQGVPLASEWHQRRVLDGLSQLSSTGLLLINSPQATATYFHGPSATISTVDLKPHMPNAYDTALVRLVNPRHSCSNLALQLSPTTTVALWVAAEVIQISHVVTTSTLDRLMMCEDSADDSASALWLRFKLGNDGYFLALQSASLPAQEGSPIAVDLSLEAPQLWSTTLPGGYTSGGDLRLAAVNAFASDKKGKIGYRVLLVTEDCTVTLVQQDGTSWHRVEGLASVDDAQFLNLPKAHPTQPGADTTVVGRLGQRLLLQMVTLRQELTAFSHWVVEETVQRIQGKKSSQQDVEEDAVDAGLAMTQDEFGFRKLILAYSTKAGMLYAIHTAGGHIAWKHRIKDIAILHLLKSKGTDTQGFNEQLISFAERCQVSMVAAYSLDEKHDSALQHQYLLVATVSVFEVPGHSSPWVQPSESQTIVFKFSVHSGKLEDVSLFQMNLIHTSLLPFTFTNGGVSTSPLLLVDASRKLQLYPDTPAAWNALRRNSARTFFHVTELSAGKCIGLGVGPDGQKAYEVWRLAVDVDKGEKVVAVSATTLDRRALLVSNTVKLFNNQTTGIPTGPEYGFKYTNPNVFAIVTSIPAPAPNDDKVSASKSAPSISLYLVDGVTGSVLSQMIHLNAVPPVALLHVENFLLYHYLNTKSMKYHIGVWQLFEDVTDQSTHTVAQGLINSLTGASPPPRSTFMLPPPLTTRNMYNFPTAVNCLGTSVTSKGITTKLILVGNPLGQVVGLPLPTLEAPKTHYISYPMQSVVTYNKTVHHLRALRTSPASLESSSHMLAIGLDLFYTRLAPAKTYDLLGDDFSHWSLLATTTALLVATIVAKGFAKRRTLALAWA